MARGHDDDEAKPMRHAMRQAEARIHARGRAGRARRWGRDGIPGGAALLGLLLSLATIATASACDPDPLFEPCPLSNSIQQACAAEAADTLYSCVVADHPFCLEGICASWLGQPSICTKACTSDTDCPEGSQCRAHLDLQFCVLDEDLAATAGGVGGQGLVAPDAAGGADAGGADAGQ